MPIIATVHKCAICLSPYDQRSEAAACELIGPPVGQRFREGTQLVFENETACGTHWSYSTVAKTVLYSFAYFNPRLHKHQWAHVVSLDNGLGSEGVVLPTEMNNLVCSADSKFRQGHADSLRIAHSLHGNSIMHPIHY